MRSCVTITSAIAATLLGFANVEAQKVVASDTTVVNQKANDPVKEQVMETIRGTEGYKDIPDDALLPITREQAEELITTLILEARKPYVEAAYRDSVLHHYKVETLKRRALDQALARTYIEPYEQRLAQLERLLYALLLSRGDIDPVIIKQLLPNAVPSTTYVPLGNQLAPATQEATKQQQLKEEVPQANLSEGHKQSDKKECTKKCTHAKKKQQKEVTPEEAIALKPGLDRKQIDLFMSVAYFGFDSSAIDKETSKTLDNVIAWMKENDLKVSLRGYASPEGRMSYNNKLSGRRVNAVADYLTKNGIPSNRLEVIPSGIDSMKDTKSKYPQGRRVEIRPILY